MDWLVEQITEDKRIARLALAGHPLGTDDGRTQQPPWEQRYHEVWQIDEESAEGDILRRTAVADCGPANVYPARHIVTWQPARVLVECEAKLRILARHAPRIGTMFKLEGQLICGCSNGDDEYYATGWPCRDVLDVAAPYADRPGYREEWRF